MLKHLEFGLQIQERYGFIVPQLITLDGIMGLLKEAPIIVGFSDYFLIRFDESIDPMKYNLSIIELMLIQSLASRENIQCRCTQEFPVDYEKIMCAMCENRSDAPNLNPERVCDFIFLLKAYLKALGIKAIKRHGHKNRGFWYV